MTDIKSILNPVDEPKPAAFNMPETADGTHSKPCSNVESTAITQAYPTQLPSPSSSVYTTRDSTPPLHARKKQRVSKDAAVFTRGTIRGELRYPPDEFRDDILAAHHQQYEIFPMGDIAKYPRHIPYNSEKKTFLNKTGRECFEVLHYNFKIPGDEKVHCMMWDYNIGLVRITPLFKCTGYSKVIPTNAESYWMPCEAAKAIAATFCWNIRYALTPVFGRDFPSTCISPDSDRFGDMIIDGAITLRCVEQAQEYRKLENCSSRGISALQSPITPDTPTYPRHIKQLRPKTLKISSHSSGYSTDASNDDAYSLSSNTPNMGYSNTWTPANTPRSAANFESRLPSPPEILAGISSRSRKCAIEESASNGTSSSLKHSPKSRSRIETDEDYDGNSSGESSLGVGGKNNSARENVSGLTLPNDVRAAYLLMSLGLEKTSLVLEKDGRGLDKASFGSEPRGQKRRYSAPMDKLVESW